MRLSNKNLLIAAVFFIGLLLLVSCARRAVRKTEEGVREEGYASWYGPGFHGRRTASGERYNMWKLTAAHKQLPFGTWVKVTNFENDRSVVVKINDRGPFKAGRVIDLSKAAAKEIGLIAKGVARVFLQILPEYASEVRRDP